MNFKFKGFCNLVAKIKKNNRGNSLIQVLIASAIAAIISLVVIQLIETSRKAQGSNEASFAKLELLRDIETALANSRNHACEGALISAGVLGEFDASVSGGPDTPIRIPTIVSSASFDSVTGDLVSTTGTLFSIGSKDNTGNLIINNMQLIKFTPNIEDPFSGVGIFEITLKKAHKDKSLGSEFFKKNNMVLKMQLWANGPNVGKTKFCMPSASSGDSIWSANGDGKIYYSGGNVGIGTLTPNKALQIVGDLEISPDVTTASTGGYVTAKAYYHSSDETLKEDIQDIDGLGLIRGLHGVMFKWKTGGNEDLGVIAQEVEKVIPYIVAVDNNSKLKSVNYDSLIAVLIEAVKSLDKKNDAQNSRIKALETEIKAIRR